MKNFLIISLLIFCSISCKKKKEINTNTIKKDYMLNLILKKQLEKGISGLINNSFDIETYTYAQEDLEIILPLLKDILVENGYTALNNDDFNNKIKNIFGRIISPGSNKNFLFTNDFDKCSKEIVFYRNDNSIDIKPFGFYIIKNDNYITELYTIPEIFQYEKDYSNIENKLPQNYINEDGEKITITKWKNLPDLEQQRRKNIQTLISRNKYLFNDSKASLQWLKLNDEYFLQSLVKTFGYVQDEELSKFVLNKNLKDNEGFGKVVWHRDCSGKFIFHNKIIDIINRDNLENQKKYIAAIYSYFEYLNDIPENNTVLNFSEKCEIQGKLAYSASKIAEKLNDGPYSYYSFFTFLNHEVYQVEFEKRNYYNIKDFKEVYDDTKTGGVTYPGMPE